MFLILTTVILPLFKVNCASVTNGEIGFCACNQCSENEGDCDSDEECLIGACGSNNCDSSLGFDATIDCCTIPAVGDEIFCTTDNKCQIDEGDCDSHDECQDGLFCGSNNCPASSTFDNEDDCCYQAILGDDNFCTEDYPCQGDEGDCDTDENCQGDENKCGVDNCQEYLGFDPMADCCIDHTGCASSLITTIDSAKWGDTICDDEINTEICKWDGGDCCGDNVNTFYCVDCECLDPNATVSRKHLRENIPKFNEFSEKNNRRLRLGSIDFNRDKNMLLDPYFEFEEEKEPYFLPEFRNQNMKRSRVRKTIKAKIGKTNNQLTKIKSECEGIEGSTYQDSSIVCNHLASSVKGLRVKLNPNVEEYKTDGVKNNFIGFKYLVHSPYDFPFVEGIGKAMGPNIQSYIAFLGFHSWITDDADAYKCDQFQCPKDCASKHDIELDVYQDYTRANCVFECQANSLFKNCGCLPYQYPEFHLANTGIWENITSQACNYTQLTCLSRVKGIWFQFNC